jgi:hypothetical protein
MFDYWSCMKGGVLIGCHLFLILGCNILLILLDGKFFERDLKRDGLEILLRDLILISCLNIALMSLSFS